MARTPTRRPRGHSPFLATLHTPLARWGFTVLAVLALTTGQTVPFLVTAAIATYAWRTRRR
ncbi:hypothetical protein P1S61_37575 [Streptomyces sp. ME08-AFT2]|uniref:hypothetical protein n=1 Tax=Streptomyces sp. ME08-AFT2 TaxID=3028683 RepID=UPI0029A86045|nr:hypothetical protein [Streptomyces sp. ME08-AFT2]MDX3314668.1 hypothetical protein [Streptomyces sp. ME08-AFT2]